MSDIAAAKILLAALKIGDENETKPNSCGCGKGCSVEFEEFPSEFTFSTTSLRIAAGVIRGQRLNRAANMRDLLLYAQFGDLPDVEDQKNAIKLFYKCPNIIEYAEKFAGWENAVRELKSELFAKFGG
ncbi:unnamed protein product [Caenorhabditis angaria]|uniref:Uncharacterized protein n=1 Tax=Caenorhabditis angaria TaxID=860376 RepID=A0A9P1IKI5_9PELO|nr:unnamed protein product [Caenorhabditis angaria]